MKSLTILRSVYHITSFWLILIVCYVRSSTCLLVNVKCTFLHLEAALLSHRLCLHSALVYVAKCFCGCPTKAFIIPTTTHNTHHQCMRVPVTALHFFSILTILVCVYWYQMLCFAFSWWLIILCFFHIELPI